MSFFAELKRRNVFRAAAFYAASAWLLVQVATQVFPFFHVAEWVVRWIVIAAVIGFPFAISLSWFYEWTPHGIQRESEVAQDESVTRVTGKKMDRWIISVLTFAVVLLLTNQFVLHKDANTSAATKSPAPGKSIAVLPFENLSADKNNAYFASGMQDMILTKLADIGDLKVIARTSTEKYQSHPDHLKAIAQQLGVATIMEGSVQKFGNSVLINVQLIDASSDAHIWAEAYPRTLDNVFGVEGEVAGKVADALRVKLLPAKAIQLATVPTRDSVAFDDFLRGEHSLREAAAGDWARALPAAVSAFQQAITRDPGFALAWARRSEALLESNFFGLDVSVANLREAKSNAQQALTLAPDLPEAHEVMGYAHRWGDFDRKSARVEYLRALQLRPNDADVIAAIAYIDADDGDIGACIAGLEQAAALNPRDANQAVQLARAYMDHGEYSKAGQALRRALAIDPQEALAYEFLSRIEVMATGDVQAALAVLDTMARGTPTNNFLADIRIQLLLYRHDFAAARSVAAAMPDKASGDALAAAMERGNVEWLAGAPAQASPLYRVAIARAREHLASNPNDDVALIALSLALARSGQPDDARIQGEQAITAARLRGQLEVMEPMRNLAAISLSIGDSTAAITELEQLMATPMHEGFISTALLKLDPTWDPIRKYPRFQMLISDAETAKAKVKP